MHADAREISALVPMPRLLEALGFEVNERTRRAPCLLQSGSNPTAFSWREDGRWHCFSCGRGGDRISLVRSVKQCPFREAVAFLAVLAGVEYQAYRVSRCEIARKARKRARAERAAWNIADEIGRLRRYYTDCLHRCELLQRKIGEQLLRAAGDVEREKVWDRLARLAAICTLFLAAWTFISNALPDALARFALASLAERRQFILGGVTP